MVWFYVTFGVIGLGLFIKFLTFIVRKIGCCCHRCGNRMNFWDELEEADRRDILKYFRQHEKRKPDTSSIFVCPHCKYVYDDFSGEKRSMEGDNASHCKVCNGWYVNYLGQLGRGIDIDAFREKNAPLLDQTECLSCDRKPVGNIDCIKCDTKFKVMGCNKCKTLYAWLPMMEKEFHYTVPLTEEKIIRKGPSSVPL